MRLIRKWEQIGVELGLILELGRYYGGDLFSIELELRLGLGLLLGLGFDLILGSDAFFIFRITVEFRMELVLELGLELN